MIANIASVFHWPLSELDDMEISELKRWHALAVDRGPKGKK